MGMSCLSQTTGRQQEGEGGGEIREGVKDGGWDIWLLRREREGVRERVKGGE